MLYKYIFLFFIYAFIGWIIEIILTIVMDHKLINRGFLIGLYLPIYGFGCVFLVLVLDKLKDNLLLLFIVTFITCSLIEYITSYVLEKIFKLRWWDYKQYKFNLNGRICLETMLPFSIGGVLAIKYITPYLLKIVNKLPLKLVIVFELILVIILIIDFLISALLIKKMNIDSTNKDDTEIIKNNMKDNIKKDIKKRIKKESK